eukprot:15366339-Ditylum_brightwellii.AAC.1
MGNNKIHRTRILSIYKANYSIFIGLMWKDLLYSSKKWGTLNRGLHGGWCSHNAQTLFLIKELKYDICYCSRKLLINFDNDAASCYDWTLPTVSSLVARKKGLHKNVTFVHAQTLKEAKYRLQNRISGQGAINSPGIWLTISSAIGDIYDQSANGGEFISTNNAIALVLAILGFIDDVTNQVNEFTDNQ